jgi:hypothetical protein
MVLAKPSTRALAPVAISVVAAFCACGSGDSSSSSSASGGDDGSPFPSASSSGGTSGSSGAAAAFDSSVGSGSSGGSSSGGGSGSSGSSGTSTPDGSSGDGSSSLDSSGSSSDSGSSGAGDSGPLSGPCDIYAAAGTPCVAAHSTVRALYGNYSGSLYQVTRASDKTTKDIQTTGGFADSASQDSFCAGTTCTISIIYDQSPKGNHLRRAPAGGAKNTPDSEAVATALKFTIGGRSVYGVHIPAGTGYRNDTTSGVATGDQPETEYMVTSGTYYNGGCCFDYGNAETNNNDDGAGTMEAVYFGNSTTWGRGSGSGPWVMADLENGLFGGQSFAANASNTPLTHPYVTAMVKGRSGGFGLKGGDAQSGTLTTMYDGARPSGGYNPMKKQGAIILGIGGDNSNGAQGNFFEGVMTSGNASDASDDAVQANIVAAGYGR